MVLLEQVLGEQVLVAEVDQLVLAVEQDSLPAAVLGEQVLVVEVDQSVLGFQFGCIRFGSLNYIK